MKTLRVAVLAAGLLATSQVGAAVIAYDNIASSPTAPTYQDYGSSLGLRFDVNQPICITALGAFDNGDIANLIGANGSGGVTVQIANMVTGLLGPSVALTPANPGTQINADAFLPISPLRLLPGQYMVVVFNDINYNQGCAPDPTFNPTSTMNDGGGLISFVSPPQHSGGPRFPGPIQFPTCLDPAGPANRYDAGTFEFEAAPVPEPTTMIAGLGALGLVLAGLRSRSFTTRIGR